MQTTRSFYSKFLSPKKGELHGHTEIGLICHNREKAVSGFGVLIFMSQT